MTCSAHKVSQVFGCRRAREAGRRPPEPGTGVRIVENVRRREN